MIIVPQEAVALAAEFEGLRLDPYHDPVGYPTIGYGHLLSREVNADLSEWESISIEKAGWMLKKDMSNAAASVTRLIDVHLSDRQFAALIDFTFNLGSGNLSASTLRKVVNREEHDKAPEQFKRWVFARGVRLPGLIRRREAEAELYIAGS